MWSVSDVISVRCDQCLMWSVCDVISVRCDQCLMWSVFDVISVRCDQCLMWSVSDVISVWCDQCLMWSVSDVISVRSDQCAMWSVEVAPTPRWLARAGDLHLLDGELVVVRQLLTSLNSETQQRPALTLAVERLTSRWHCTKSSDCQVRVRGVPSNCYRVNVTKVVIGAYMWHWWLVQILWHLPYVFSSFCCLIYYTVTFATCWYMGWV